MGDRVEEDSGIDGARLRVLARGLEASTEGDGWWPYKRPFEVMLSAVLTQRTQWASAAKAMERLRAEGLLGARALKEAKLSKVEAAVRGAGFYRQKAAALKGMGETLVERFGGSVGRLFDLDDRSLRKELLSWRGIGPETADAIMLYAAHRPVFVVDAYTLRLQRRFGAVERGADPTYDQTAGAWRRVVGSRVEDLKRVHGLIVDHCKGVCAARPDCGRCVLRSACAQVL